MTGFVTVSLPLELAQSLRIAADVRARELKLGIDHLTGSCCIEEHKNLLTAISVLDQVLESKINGKS